MRKDEAFYILAKEPGFRPCEKYGEALQAIHIGNIGSNSNVPPYAYYYCNVKNNYLGMTTAKFDDTNYILLKTYSYSELFDECSEFTYESYKGPGLSREYDIPMSMSSYEDLIDYILRKETDQDYFFMDPSYVRFRPAYETNDTYVWQVFIYDNFAEMWYCVGLFTVYKS